MMNRLLAILLLAQQILIGATFTSSTTAAITWQQPPGIPLTCLRIYHIGAEYPAGICYPDLPPGPVRVDLPGALTHPAYRPAWGDRIVLAFGMDDVGSAVLGEAAVYTLYMPLAMKSAAQSERRVYVAWVAR